MRHHVEAVGVVIDDYLDFKEFNNKDNLIDILRGKKKQEKTDSELFQAKDVLDKFRKD